MFTVWATLAVGVREDLNQLELRRHSVAIDEVMLKATEPIRLMEDMAQRVIDHLAKNPTVASLSVRIEKPEAPLPHPGGLPVIEVLWDRA